MRDDFTKEFNGHVLEYFDDEHIYLLDGVIVPSISRITKATNPDQYAGISEEVLKRAASAGTAVHKAIEDWCIEGTESDLPELRGFKFLQKHYKFEVMANEIPVAYFKDTKPFMAGRLDLLLMIDGKFGLADIKRTSTLEKNNLAYQLNLYRIAYEQTYEQKIEFLAGIHLHELTRKYVDIPLNDEIAFDAIDIYERTHKK